jgi:hypothetical protein
MESASIIRLQKIQILQWFFDFIELRPSGKDFAMYPSSLSLTLLCDSVVSNARTRG